VKQQMTTQRLGTITTGWDVFGSDGEKLGTIDEIGSNYFLVRKGFIFTSDVFVPQTAVARVDPDQSQVFLNLPKNQIETLGWDQPPTGDAWQPGTDVPPETMNTRERTDRTF
jgi:hypothetical protein